MKNRLRQKYRNYCIIAFNATEKLGVFFCRGRFFWRTLYIAFTSFRGVSRGDLPFLQFKKLKGHSHQFRSAWKLLISMGLGWDICHAWYFLKLNSSLNFYWAFQVLKQPTPNTYVPYHLLTEWRILLILAALRLLCRASLFYTPGSLTNQNLCNLTLDQPECRRCFCPVPSGDGISSKSNRNPPVLTWWTSCTILSIYYIHLEQLLLLLESRKMHLESS